MRATELVQTSDHSVKAAAFQASLISWGREHFRSFPWRLTRNPYYVLVAEVMLHRTQAIQVVPVYERFIALYPDVFALANAPEDEVYALLYPLGLRWRAELLLQMVAHLMKHAPATIPQDKEKLLALPGVSEYIASAVRCFTWEYPDPLIDTNTVRVIGRVFGLEIKDSSRRNAVFRRLTVELVSRDNPRAYNFALLDLAAIVCTKTRHPDCGRCPLLRYCQYGSSSIANEC